MELLWRQSNITTRGSNNYILEDPEDTRIKV